MAGKQTSLHSSKSLDAVASLFRRQFHKWGLDLTAEHLAAHNKGIVVGGGWNIQYLLGNNERGTYLDYYASHRMSGDDHYRIYASGEIQELDFLMSGCHYDRRIPGDKERAEARVEEHNRKVGAILEAKGFGALTIYTTTLVPEEGK